MIDGVIQYYELCIYLMLSQIRSEFGEMFEER